MDSYGSTAYSFFFGQSSSGKVVNERTAIQATAVYSCVQILSEAIASLPGRDLQWGMDFINGIAEGVRRTIGNVASAVSDVADAIRSYLHFSVPDVGPLTDYESWMPDFMGGLARGIEKSRGLEMKEAEMFVEGYKAVLVKDTSFKGLWKVSFTLREF